MTRAVVLRLCRALLVVSAVLLLALAGVVLVAGVADGREIASASSQFLRREVMLMLATPAVTLAALRARGSAAAPLRFAAVALGLAVLLRGVRLGAGAPALALGAVAVGAVLVLACLGIEVASRER